MSVAWPRLICFPTPPYLPPAGSGPANQLRSSSCMAADDSFATFLHWLDLVVASPQFRPSERLYKLALSDGFHQTVVGRRDPQLILAWLRQEPNNLVGWRLVDKLAKSPALIDLPAKVEDLMADGDLGQRIADFGTWLRSTAGCTPGEQASLASVLLMAAKPIQYPPYKPEAIRRSMKLAGRRAPAGTASARYLDFIRFCDELVTGSKSTIDRLDAQGFCWIVGGYRSSELEEVYPTMLRPSTRGGAPIVPSTTLWIIFRQRCLIERLSLNLPDGAPSVDQMWTPSAPTVGGNCSSTYPTRATGPFWRSSETSWRTCHPGACQLLVDLTWLHLVVSRSRWGQPRSGSCSPTSPDPGRLHAERRRRPSTGTRARQLWHGLYHVRPNQFWLSIRFAQQWLAMSTDDNRRLLADPWDFRDLVFDLPGSATRANGTRWYTSSTPARSSRS